MFAASAPDLVLDARTVHQSLDVREGNTGNESEAVAIGLQLVFHGRLLNSLREEGQSVMNWRLLQTRGRVQANKIESSHPRCCESTVEIWYYL